MSNNTCSYEGCNREIYAGKDKCIFHVRKENGQEVDEFYVQFRDLIANYERSELSNWDFRGFIFPDIIKFTNRPFRFGGLRYGQNVDFSHTTFEGDADFGGTYFNRGCKYANAKFKGKAYFNGMKSHGKSDLSDFTDAKFWWDASFENAHFEGKACFSGAEFRYGVDFPKAQFKKDVDFIGAIFKIGVFFNETKFGGDVRFGHATKQTLFCCDANFTNSYFERGAMFENCVFEHGILLCQVVSENQIVFDKTLFREKIDLDSSIFIKRTHFTDCRYEGEVKVRWPGEYRRKEVLSDPTDQGAITFDNITKDSYFKRGVLDFSWNDLREGCRIIFVDCDLSRTKFEGTDCRKVEFVKCTWPICRGRDGVGDEFLGRFAGKGWWHRWFRYALRIHIPGGDWERIEDTYNYLASNYSSRLDYPHVHSFDAGALEMQRLDCVPERGWRRRLWDRGKILQWALAMQHRYFSFISFYRYFTAYGNRYLRPLGWLICIYFGFSLLYYGFINTLCFSQAMRLSLAIATLNRTGMEEAFKHSIWLDGLASFQIILTATLVALFLFAVRRRFKR